MKVLHIWLSDSATVGAGGAVAMSRLHNGLRDAGIDSRILCEHKVSNSDYITTMNRPNKWELRLRKLTEKIGLNDIHRLSTFQLNRHPWYQSADLVTLHGTHHGFMNYLALPKLTNYKSTVFVLHDMWALTGHCAYSFNCDRWKNGCGQCPQLDSPPAVKRDSTRLEWRLKNWVYRRSRMSIISPSSSLAAQARESMLSRFPISHIPHGINTKIYQPLDKITCRADLGIPDDKKVIMFAAVNTKEKRKGGDLLLQALAQLPERIKKDVVILTLGKAGQELADIAQLPAINMGFIESDRQKSTIYSSADIFVTPTRGEAFGLTILESIACGTPVVAFGVGGVLDLVKPGVTGYRAEPENASDLSYGITQLLENDELRSEFVRQGVEMVQKEFTLELQITRYIKHYKQILDNSKEHS